MDIAAIQTFIAVAEAQNFTRAAEKQFCTQAAISMRIKRLEAELECVLFKRMAKKTVLTHEGEVFLPFAKQMVNVYASAKDSLFQSRLMEHSEISLASSSTPGTYIIPNMMYLFRQKYPYITVLNHVQYTKSVIESVLHGNIPLGIVSQPVLDNTDQLVVEPIMEDPLTVIVSLKHPWAGRPGIRLREISQETLLISNPNTSMVKYVEKCGRFTIDPKNLYVVGNLEAIKRSVASNLGVSIMSRYAVQQELELGLLREVAVLEDCTLTRTIYAIHLKDNPPALSTKLFLEFMQHSVKLEQEAAL